MHYAKGGVADCRSDHFVDEQGRLLMAWAYQIAGRKDGCDEILILGFALKDDPKTGGKAEKSRPDVTHEMSAYLVDPETPIDFGTSLFEQHRVSPLTPALATVQWQANSDAQALLMAGNRVAALMGEVSTRPRRSGGAQGSRQTSGQCPTRSGRSSPLSRKFRRARV